MNIVLSGGSIIDFDGTSILQLGIFFLTFIVLRMLIFKPVMAVFEAREQAIDGVREKAAGLQDEAAQYQQTFDTKMRKMRLAASEERERLRQDGIRLEQSILHNVRTEVQDELSAAKSRLDQEAQRARTQVQAQSQELAQHMVNQLVGAKSGANHAVARSTKAQVRA